MMSALEKLMAGIMIGISLTLSLLALARAFGG